MKLRLNSMPYDKIYTMIRQYTIICGISKKRMNVVEMKMRMTER